MAASHSHSHSQSHSYSLQTSSPSPAPTSSSFSDHHLQATTTTTTTTTTSHPNHNHNSMRDISFSSSSPTSHSTSTTTHLPSISIPSNADPHQFVPSAYDPSYFYTNSGPIPFHPSITPSTSPGVPVFEPTLKVFSNFESYCNGIDSWGMSTGIIKIVPPKQWSGSLPSLNSKLAETNNTSVKQVIIRNAIAQHFTAAGSGVWRQTNVTRSRMWNLKQWSDLCQEKDQKGPEMNRIRNKLDDPVPDLVKEEKMKEKNKNRSQSRPKLEIKKDSEEGIRTRSGRIRAKAPPPPPSKQSKRKREVVEKEEEGQDKGIASSKGSSSSTTNSPADSEEKVNEGMPALEDDFQSQSIQDQQSRPASPTPSNSNSSNQAATPSATSNLNPSTSTATTTSKRKPRLTGRALTDSTTAEEWETFNHETCWLDEALEDPSSKPESSTSTSEALIPKASDWSPSYCKELEGEYWRGLNFGKPPMYGADLKGTLFTDQTRDWNVGKLDNLLTRLKMKKKLPGVTTPYLYLGMWRATFAWHVEDMDLYSINYIHFGAPKQWYSIRQADRGRFESALQGSFPQDSSRCPHFMRHKSYLVSPSYLHNHGIESLHLVQHAQEFVITYPFGYHSGYNLGFNCAESVNFALDSWIDIGRKAGFCKCSEESVHMDIDAILEESRKLEEEERLRESEREAKEKARLRERNRLEKIRIQNLEKQNRMKAMASSNPYQNPNAMYDFVPSTKKIKLTNNNNQQYLSYNQMPAYNHQYGYAPAYPFNQAPQNGYSYPPYGYSQNLPQLQQPPASPRSTPKAPMAAAKLQEKNLPQNSCCLCPSDVAEDLVKVKGKDGSEPLFAHRLCASFIPETWVGRKSDEENADVKNTAEEVKGYDGIAKARWNLKCGVCTDATLSRKGAKIQCTWGSCPRAAHVSCVLGLEAMLDSEQNKNQNNEESDALREESGWFLDVLNPEDADKLEGKGKFKPSKGKGKKKGKQPTLSARSSEAPASDPVGNESLADVQKESTPVVDGQGEERLVILCKSHNPLFKQLEESRKNDAIRTLALRLPIGQTIEVKYGVGYSASVILCEVQDREGGASGEGEGSVVVKDMNVQSSDPNAPPPDPSQIPANTLKWKNIIWSEDQEKELISLKDGGAEEKRLKAKLEAEERLKKRKMMQRTAEEDSLEEERAMKLKGIIMRQEKAERKRMEELMALNNGNNGNGNAVQMHPQFYAAYQQQYSHSQNPQHQQQQQFPSYAYTHNYPAPVQSRPPQYQQHNYPQQSSSSQSQSAANGSHLHYQPSHLQQAAPRPAGSMPITSFSHQQSKPGMIYTNNDSFKNASSNGKPNPFLPPLQPQSTHPQPSYYAYQQGAQATRDWQQLPSPTYSSQRAGPNIGGTSQINGGMSNGNPNSISDPRSNSYQPSHYNQPQPHQQQIPGRSDPFLYSSQLQRQPLNNGMSQHGGGPNHYDSVRSLNQPSTSLAAPHHPPVTSGTQ